MGKTSKLNNVIKKNNKIDLKDDDELFSEIGRLDQDDYNDYTDIIDDIDSIMGGNYPSDYR